MVSKYCSHSKIIKWMEDSERVIQEEREKRREYLEKQAKEAEEYSLKLREANGKLNSN